MQNMSVGRRGESAFQYRTGTTGDVIEVAVRHENGGPNWFHGGSSPRGVYLAVSPVKLEDGLQSFALGEGWKALILPLARRSDKQTARVAEVVDALAPEIARRYGEARAEQIASGVHYLSVRFPFLREVQNEIRVKLGLEPVKPVEVAGA